MRSIRLLIAVIWSELRKPEVGDNWYAWATIATGHVLLGALFITAVRLFIDAPEMWVAVVVAYWVCKEVHDIRRGGSDRDSLIDAGFVGIGTAYGAEWMPAVAMTAIAVGAIYLAGVQADD